MLILRRKRGQSIQIGDTKLTLIDRSSQCVRFELDDGTCPAVIVRMMSGAKIPLANGAVITIMPLGKPSNGVCFGIDAPRHIPIHRDDVVLTEPKPKKESHLCLPKLLTH